MDDLSLNVLLKLSEQEARDLDRVRGDVARATWVKALIRGAVEARDRLGRPTDVWVVGEDEAKRVWEHPTPLSGRSPKSRPES